MQPDPDRRRRRRVGARAAAGQAVYVYLLATLQGEGASIAMDQAIKAWRALRPEDDEKDARSEIELAIARKLQAGPDGNLVWRL
jgi:hypothetical protein